MFLTRLFALLLVVALAGTTSAQLIEVPGDFPDLQAAIDGASPGATIFVHGGTHHAITIDKALTILGKPAPTIEDLDGLGYLAAPITLAGPGSGEVVLGNIHVGGVVNGNIYSSSVPGLSGGGFSELHVYDSVIHAPEWCCLSGLGLGKPGIDTSVPFVLIESSDVKGAATNIDSTFTTRGWDGADAISAPGTVVVLDSVITGGDSALFCHPSDLCDFGCPGGSGGSGVVADRVFHAGSTIAGGFGSVWKAQSGEICCGGSNGTPVVAATSEIAQPDYLTGDDTMAIGEDYVLHLGSPGPLALLRLARGVIPPVHFASGFSFLDPSSTTSLGLVATPGDYTLSIPDDLSLLGRITALQAVDQSSGFTRLLARMIVPGALQRPASTPTATVTRSL